MEKYVEATTFICPANFPPCPPLRKRAAELAGGQL